jgi:hypothetical protein
MIVKDSTGQEYQVVKGTYYHPATPQSLIDVLEAARNKRMRLAIQFDPDEALFVHRGYIGRSTGIYQIPLLVYNARSLGGPALSDQYIVEVRESKGGRLLWRKQ